MTDTIAAIATPAGRGGVGIVRLSGPDVPQIATDWLGHVPEARRAELHTFTAADGSSIDQGIALYFPAPNSFTGEHVLELQGHGGPVVMDLLLSRALELGARIARPGEFSERAFLNDKLDLAQAEAIADLIDSATSQAARAAVRSLEGEFSGRIHELVEGLIRLRMYVEAAIDFPEEEIDFLADAQVTDQLQRLTGQFDALQASARQGRLLREGMRLVIAGRPNAGKSSLLNALAGRESAIVTPIAGTTRDVLREHIQIDGMPLHVIDTAGLRESEDQVEQEGVRRAWREIEQADRLLLVIDSREGFTDEDRAILGRLPETLQHTLVYNKIDLTGEPPALDAEKNVVHLSATAGAGLEELRVHLKTCMGYAEAETGGFIARRRHLDAIERARRHLQTGREQLETQRAGELLAEELRLAQAALGEITGEFTSDDLLGRIFSSFCIGK
ncbi:tRNA uridine-5-carboxymethylaminomethyl(34) synthesis GTPase MnmE [Thiohalobacter thiocyanaticus]|uniref:tRNA modification GTPase MnmE n=1 Tax=Thiohalobacter thiocyanaticus TaxID=585455 RepID=A0A426QJN2_9GAMM|nr:tRNA uridine-5-carboxymethylaminomethyl(34) synthesis GTPase MnmE [Thiohalobacter thiocyanaticus]RRQ21974.1 tRNA uridine-5-carboxymethylaminomethyl(34) synthesis GTPase MnmE [Thiohalobacter thiocyanaticus]